MSYRLTALAIESDLKPNDRLVFIALAHCANDSKAFCATTQSWKCWPSIDRLARYTSLSESSIRRALKSLASAGIVQITYRPQPGHRNLSNVYTLFNPGRPANDSTVCVREEVAPSELRPSKETENCSEAMGVILAPTPIGEGVTQIWEGVSVAPEQIKQTNNKNNLLLHEQFDPRIPPNFVEPIAWRDYIQILLRRGKPLPDEFQHSAQGEFLGAFDPATQIKIVQQSLRNGWISLHPVRSVRQLNMKRKDESRRSLLEDLTDRSWAT